MIGKTNAWAAGGSVPESPTTHKVITIDPFGVVNEQWVEHGTNGIVPTPRVHEYLTFVEYNQSFENVTEDRVIGAIYDTTDGKTYAKIRLTTVSGLAPILYIVKSDNSTLTVDWGDGSLNTYTNIGYFNTGAHTYSAIGEYWIKLYISSGTGRYNLGRGSGSTSFVGGNDAKYKDSLLSIYIGYKCNIPSDGFHANRSLSVCSIPNTVTSIGNSAFSNCFALSFSIIPIGITIIEYSTYLYCYSLKFASFPNTLTRINNTVFRYCYSLNAFFFPKNVDNLGTDVFQYCYALESVWMPNGLLIIPNSTFSLCYALKSIVIPSSVTTIGSGSFNSCYPLKSIVIPSSVNAIQSLAFQNLTSITEYIFYSITPPTLGSTTIFSLNNICKIYVPDASVTAYKIATNWVTYANYIYPLSDIGE